MELTLWPVLGGLLPAFEVIGLVLHIVFFFAILIPVANLGTPGNAYELFTRFENVGGWSSNGLAFLIGLKGLTGAFVGKLATPQFKSICI